MSDYDVQRRTVEICGAIPEGFNGRCLEVGCGTGAISRSLRPLIDDLTVTDISAVLSKDTAQLLKCAWSQEDGMALSFENNSFDLVVSSECIEHTPDPQKCVTEMLRVLSPGGTLIVTTPNRLWWPVVRVAQILRIRKFQGNEKFLSVRKLSSTIEQHGGQIIRRSGCHLFPWHLPFAKPVLKRIDKYGEFLYPVMINQVAIAIKLSD
jgi:2-polyprenyl-6-hydroxyphenyl methylase/3-demethylubiquinone-9 3-methyltransferase